MATNGESVVSADVPNTLDKAQPEVSTTEIGSPFSWSNQDGAYRRKLGSMESFYLSLATPEGYPVHWMIGCSVTLASYPENVDVEEAIRKAWERTRSEFPCLGAVVDSSSREIVVRESLTTEEWLQKSFRVHDNTTSDELFSAFKSQFHITLHYIRSRKQLLLQSPHTLIDGRGMAYLYHALFTALSTQSTGHAQTDAPNLSKPYDEWLSVSSIPSEKSFGDAQSIFARVLRQQKLIRLPGVDFDATPQRAVHRELELDEKTTSAIVQAAKKKGVSVTSAWHAALALTTQKLQSDAGEEGTSYVSVTTIDLRRHFPASFIPQKHSIGSLQTALPFAADLGEDNNTFEALSQSLHQQYKAPFAFANNDFDYLNPYMAMSRRLLENGGVPPSSTPSLSSMGVVDDFLQRRYGDWAVDKFWISSTMMTGDFQMYLWTFRERMTFSVCYNEAFYEAEHVDRIMEKTRDEMIRGLGAI